MRATRIKERNDIFASQPDDTTASRAAFTVGRMYRLCPDALPANTATTPRTESAAKDWRGRGQTNELATKMEKQNQQLAVEAEANRRKGEQVCGERSGAYGGQKTRSDVTHEREKWQGNWYNEREKMEEEECVHMTEQHYDDED